MVVGGGESDYSVCPRPLLQFLQFFQFMSDSLCQVTQVTSGYVRLRQFTSEGRDVELDNIIQSTNLDETHQESGLNARNIQFYLSIKKLLESFSHCLGFYSKRSLCIEPLGNYLQVCIS